VAVPLDHLAAHLDPAMSASRAAKDIVPCGQCQRDASIARWTDRTEQVDWVTAEVVLPPATAGRSLARL
jgi:hypothetical protein